MCVYVYKCEQWEIERKDRRAPWGCPVAVGDRRGPIFFGSITLGSGSLQEKEHLRPCNTQRQAPWLRALLGDQVLQWLKDIPE